MTRWCWMFHCASFSITKHTKVIIKGRFLHFCSVRIILEQDIKEYTCEWVFLRFNKQYWIRYEGIHDAWCLGSLYHHSVNASKYPGQTALPLLAQFNWASLNAALHFWSTIYFIVIIHMSWIWGTGSPRNVLKISSHMMRFQDVAVSPQMLELSAC